MDMEQNVAEADERLADQEQNVDEVDDRISSIPDCLLHHILSFLPIKEVVKTSVLSKRWKCLWTSVPSLNFDDSLFFPESDIPYPPEDSLPFSDLTYMWYPLDVTRFMNSIEKVLLMRNEYSSLNTFRLCSRICFSATVVYDWITCVIEQNVQELDLSIILEQPFILPTRVFHNPKIKFLKLSMTIVLHLPPNISLPSLKTLHLHHVTFPSDNLMESLFSSCPSLTGLSILDCDWRNIRSISITIPSLQILAIYDFPIFRSNNLEGCKIRVVAGNLRLFIYTGNLRNEINLYDISTRAVASVDILIHGGIEQQIADRNVTLFRGLKNISCLIVSEDTIKYLFRGDNVLPTFRNLEALNLKGKFGKRSIELLIKFLRCLPKLEFLRVCEGLDQNGEDGKLMVGPNYVLSRLKTVNYHNLQGTDAELCFLKFVLQNATALEKMNLFWSTNFVKEPTEREMIADLLHGVCRGSSLCVLTLT